MNQIPNIEEIANKYLDNYDGDYCGDCYDCNKKKKGLIATIHQQLQKAREEERSKVWEETKEDIERLTESLTKMRQIIIELSNNYPVTLIDHSELDQDKK